MYEKLKQRIKRLLPKGFLFHNEIRIRNILYLFYKGNNKLCNICEKKLRDFIHLNNGTRMCPVCGSIDRNRRLFDILNGGIIQSGMKILDFSPSRCLFRKLKNVPAIEYTGTDYAGEFLADKSLDITAIEEEDAQYDLIICYHVLEHIEDDQKAMKELFRILRKGGICILQTPFKDGETYEDRTKISPKEREVHFGQADHVRIYSAEGLKSKLSNAGFVVEIKKYLEKKENLKGFKEEEYVLVAEKH